MLLFAFMVVEQAVGGKLLAGRFSAFPVSIGALQEQCRHFLQQFVAADAAVEQVERLVLDDIERHAPIDCLSVLGGTLIQLVLGISRQDGLQTRQIKGSIEVLLDRFHAETTEVFQFQPGFEYPVKGLNAPAQVV